MRSRFFLLGTCFVFSLQTVAESKEIHCRKLDDDHRVKAADDLLAKATAQKLDQLVYEIEWLIAEALKLQIQNEEEKNQPSGVKQRQEWDEIKRFLAEKLKQKPHQNVNTISVNETDTNPYSETAFRVKQYLNINVDPCDDFNQFACGSFLKNTIPDDKTSVDSFSIAKGTLFLQLKSVLEDKNMLDEPESFTLAKNLYQTCTNESKIEEQGLNPLHTILEKLGGWPVLEEDEWNEKDFDWEELIYNFRNTGYPIDFLIGFRVKSNFINSTNRIIYIDRASLKLTREYIDDDKFIGAYYKYMVDIAVILGANKTKAQNELRESLKFEKNLLNISLSNEERRNSKNAVVPMDLQHLQKLIPFIHWKKYINNLLPNTVQVKDDEVVIVTGLMYLVDLEKLVQKTPNRVLANYLMWRVVFSSIEYLNKVIRNRRLRYLTKLVGRTKYEPRWKECVEQVTEKLPIIVGAMYIRKHFNKSLKMRAEEMVEDIRKAFLQILNNVKWMDSDTKESAVEKALNMVSKVGYSNDLLDDKKIDELHAKLQVDDDAFLQNVLNVEKFMRSKIFEQLREPVDKNDLWRNIEPAVVNAVYEPLTNSIHIPAGILQGLFFHADHPRYMNYGSIGAIVGHEITHGFDNIGHQFDKDGNFVNWWSPCSKDNYQKKAQCIIDQYGNYTAEKVGLKVNGFLTQGENIADNGGVKIAYKAYSEWVKRNGPESKLPGLEYTPNQMFWISFANTWCMQIRPKMLKYDIKTDPHSPGEFRVVGPLSNMPEFAEDFNCPVGSKMNPKNKCSVW